MFTVLSKSLSKYDTLNNVHLVYFEYCADLHKLFFLFESYCWGEGLWPKIQNDNQYLDVFLVKDVNLDKENSSLIIELS